MTIIDFQHGAPTAEYAFAKRVHVPTLQGELVSSGLSAYLCRVEASDALVKVFALRPLGPHLQTKLRKIIDMHRTQAIAEAENKEAVMAALDFGKVLIAEFGAENMALGFTQQQVAALSSTYAPVISFILTGSLRTALMYFEMIPPNALVSAERKKRWSNRVRAFFGMPLL